MAEKRYKVTWTKKAASDYQTIISYLVDAWPIQVAEDFINILENKLNNLSNQPFIGKTSSKNPAIRSILITKHNRLYYRIIGNNIQVLNMFDTRQNPSKNKFE